jgi:ATPase subunit of ABC transporter with duplicated ATPase domains
MALVISHDQRFLDNAATHILDVDYGTITPYTGNYGAFVVEKVATRKRKEAEIGRAEKVIAEKRAFVERFGAKATKAKQAQSRLKQIEKIEVEDLADSSRREPLFRFTEERPSGKDVLELAGVSRAFGDKQVLREVSLTVRRGERVAVIGPNGLGKSTLLRIVMGRLAADDGTVRLGHEVRPGYFAQDHHELLRNEAATPLDYVWDAVPREPTTYVRGQLGRLLFSGEDVTKPVGALSGGEAARLIFCRIVVEKPNFLVLDEPTNHLDLEAIHALVKGLLEFSGTLIFVSHDRAFVSALATRVVELRPDGPNDFPGTYAEYLARCGDDHLDADAVALRARSEKKMAQDADGTQGGSWEDQKRDRNRRRALPLRRDALLLAIEEKEAEKAELLARFGEPGFFERTSRDEQARLSALEASVGRRIDELMAEWEQVEGELASLGP